MNDLTSYQIDDELLLFSEQDKTLHCLNTIGALIYLDLMEGLSVEQIIRRIIKQYNIPYEVAEADVIRIKDELSSLSESTKKSYPNPPQQNYSQPLSADHKRDFETQLSYGLLDAKILIRCSKKEFADQIVSIIGHLKIEASPSYDIVLDIIDDGDQCFVAHNNIIINAAASLEHLAPVVIYEFTRLAYQSTDYLLAVHSAVVGDDHYCMMLPGLSGSGKSTLTAALIASGFYYYTDETAILKPKTHLVIPVPISIGIKTNSWPVLKPFYPQLEHLTVHAGVEERRVRYIPPKPELIPGKLKNGKPVKAIFFPNYVAESETVVTPLSRVEGLKLLTDSGYETKDNLNTNKVSELVDWIASVECYHLQYSSLDEVIVQIRGVFDE
ncbi:MAG: PqqD family peptide modification chaperone [Proteobacteria bacterium]|nr:PqqD family peptide modification chaperone [Pseudomonadota bacterium]